MEGKRFDQLARHIAGGNRRSFLQGAAIAVAGLAGLARRGVDAACRPGGGYCQRHTDCCSGKCFEASRGGRQRICCTAETQAVTCDGQCGLVENNCGQFVDCGENCCMRDGNGCESNELCCSGICQGGICEATVSGSCTGAFGNQSCGNGTCTCIGTVETGLVCASAPSSCFSDCAECKGGDVCCEDSFKCGEGNAVCAYSCPPEGGAPLTCFTGDTRIAMGDGSSRAIEDVQIGEQVLGQNGVVNTVLSIETPNLGNRLLYSLNGSGYFVTAEHPFLTDAGWKSIDPAATEREHAAVKTTALRVGDMLLALAGVLAPVGRGGFSREALEIETRGVELQQIESVSSDSATRLYNLKLDGDHTYFANELVVHNK